MMSEKNSFGWSESIESRTVSLRVKDETVEMSVKMKQVKADKVSAKGSVDWKHWEKLEGIHINCGWYVIWCVRHENNWMVS